MPTTRDRLLDLLAARPGLAQHELADRLGVSTRTARRHLGSLEAAGTAVATPEGPATRYRLADGAHPATPVPHFTDDEAEALAVAALAARPLLAPTPLAVALDAASKKLRAAALAEVLSFEPEADDAHWSFDGVAGGISKGLDPTVFRALLDAARNGHAVRADYFTASRQSLGEGRTLGPLALMVRNGGWMVACLDRDAEAGDVGHPVKDFALAGFLAVVLLPAVAADPPAGWSLDTYGSDRLGALDGETEEVRLWVSPQAAPYFQRKDYSRTQIVEEEQPDGALVVSFETAGLEDARAFCMGWGAKVRVLDPPALADAVAHAHREAAAQYGSASVDSQLSQSHAMRLNLRLSPNTAPVPFDHLHQLTGTLHKWLGENEVHDGLSLYSFGWLSGGRAQGGHVQFPNGATWAVSFVDPDLGKQLLSGLMADPEVAYGMAVQEAQIAEEPEFGPEHRFLTASPVLARRTRDDGGRDHLRWDDPAAADALTRTFHTKLAAAGLPIDGASLAFDRQFHGAKTKLCHVKGNAYRANACPVVGTGSPDQLRLLWLAGAGEMTGSGFGALR